MTKRRDLSKKDANLRSSQPWTADIAMELFAALDSSGLSIADFARSRGLDPRRLYWWRKRLGLLRRRSEVAATFQEVSVPARAARSPDHGTAQIEVVLRSGHLLRIQGLFEGTVLRQLIASLEGAEC